MSQTRVQVQVPAERVERWLHNFESRHGATGLRVVDGELSGLAEDGSSFTARLPFEGEYAGPPEVAPFAVAAGERPADWGLLVVRKGGFAVVRMHGTNAQARKVGRRHVQGRSKAGGWSQQRFARRRGEQARHAFEAAAEHAARLLAGLSGPLVTGGDHGAVADVLADPRLRDLRVVRPWLAVPDPKGETVDKALVDAAAVAVSVINA